MFKCDHVSTTLGFDQDYKFDPVELELQVMKASFRRDYNLLTPLVQYNFTTGHAWDFRVIVSFEDLLQNLEGSEDPPTWAMRFFHNWTCYVEHLIYDVEIGPTTNNKILNLMHVHGIPTPKKSSRTMDHLHGARGALENYKNLPTDEWKKAVEEWRVATAKVATDPKPTPDEVAATEEPPAKRRAT